MVTVGMHEAKTHFSRLVEKALEGEEVVVTRSGEPVITFTPVRPRKTPNIGFAAGTIWVADDFDTLPDEVLAEFEK
jgi:prevent-host-death family protein